MNEPNPEQETVLDSEQIKALIPHRYPFLLVDRITKMTDDTCTGYKNVTINDNFLQGHFPEKAVMPGVLIIEGMAQTGAAFYNHKQGTRSDKLIFFAGINKAKFRKPVFPGDRLVYEVQILQIRSVIMTFTGKAYVDGKLACEAEMMASLVDK
jgi:beta-hydroxyacyl-ACP dehydratase FabZ